MVRDGRLQTPKKRTDRSYLRPTPGVADEALPEDAAIDESVAPDEALPESGGAEAPIATSAEPTTAFAAPTPVPAPAGPVAGTTTYSKLPTAVRAIQQQGVRKRRDIDLHALAVRDTNYAIHEIRRIAILTIMVIVSLVVLTLVLR